MQLNFKSKGCTQNFIHELTQFNNVTMVTNTNKNIQIHEHEKNDLVYIISLITHTLFA